MRTIRPIRRTLAATAATVALLAASLLAAAPATAAAPLPTRMAALGDSITQASMTCTILYACPANSWSTGTTSSIASHASRLRALGTSLTAYNDAVPGSTSADLPGQATKAVTQGAQYVTIEIGANDACADSVSAMTSVQQFSTNVSAALATLSAGSAQPSIFVASVPNIKRLWDVNKSNVRAWIAWGALGFCDSMLAKPWSKTSADNQRRDAVQQRVNDYNAVLATLCASTAKCTWDGGAVAATQFSTSDISTKDYFHPSSTGQRLLAAVTWAKSPWGP